MDVSSKKDVKIVITNFQKEITCKSNFLPALCLILWRNLVLKVFQRVSKFCFLFNPNRILAITFIGSIFASYLLATALYSPGMLWGADIGGTLTVSMYRNCSIYRNCWTQHLGGFTTQPDKTNNLIKFNSQNVSLYLDTYDK